MATRPPAESAAFPPSRSRAVLQQHISRTPSRELRGWFRLPRHEDRAIDRILTNSPPTGRGRTRPYGTKPHRGGLRAQRPLRASAAADERLGGVPRQLAPIRQSAPPLTPYRDYDDLELLYLGSTLCCLLSEVAEIETRAVVIESFGQVAGEVGCNVNLWAVSKCPPKLTSRELLLSMPLQ